MKYNPDCVRAVLLRLEQELILIETDDGCFNFKEVRLLRLFECLADDFSKADIIYSLQKLTEVEFITSHIELGDDVIIPECCFVKSITFKGHEFLENIRENKNWTKIKNAGKTAGSFALNLLGEIAKDIALGAAQAYLSQAGLPL